MKDIKFDNFARLIGTRVGTEQYQWRVFVNEDKSILDKIENITYLLHPTFAEPLHIIDNRQTKFALESIGWGEFIIQITIKFTDDTEKKQRYYLDLSKDWPTTGTDNKNELLKILHEEQWYARTFTEIKNRVPDLDDEDIRNMLKQIGAVKVKIPKRDEEFWGFAENVIRMLLDNDKWDMRSFNTISYYFPETSDDDVRSILKKIGSKQLYDENGKEMWMNLRK